MRSECGLFTRDGASRTREHGGPCLQRYLRRRLNRSIVPEAHEVSWSDRLENVADTASLVENTQEWSSGQQVRKNLGGGVLWVIGPWHKQKVRVEEQLK